jgi:hypothetical protein
MSLSDLASLGSFVSGVAVLISLVYLALQVRQAERNQRAIIQSTRTARVIDVSLRRADYATVFRKALLDNELTGEELFQFHSLSIAMFYGWEDSFYQHQERALDDKGFASMVVAVRGAMANPSQRAIWKISRDFFEETFRAFVDGIVLETKPRRPYDVLPEYKAALAAELEGAI